MLKINLKVLGSEAMPTGVKLKRDGNKLFMTTKAIQSKVVSIPGVSVANQTINVSVVTTLEKQ
jgi:hypothetical protein